LGEIQEKGKARQWMRDECSERMVLHFISCHVITPITTNAEAKVLTPMVDCNHPIHARAIAVSGNSHHSTNANVTALKVTIPSYFPWLSALY
jgi:hypothetical protein